jgi:two-component system, NtrC family, sensor kinase
MTTEQRLRMLADGLPQLVWTAGPEGGVDYCNRRWAEFTGMSLENARRNGWIEAIHPADAPIFSQVWQHCLRTGKPFETECRLKRGADGVFRWHLARAMPSRHDDGSVTAWCGTFTDIDDIKCAAEEMGGLERFVDSIVENIPDMVFVKDAKNLRFVRVNRRAEEDLFGRPRQELIGRTDYDFSPKEEADAFTANDRTVLESGMLLDIPEEMNHTPRGPRIMHTKKIPLLDGDGKPQYLLGIARDITRRKEVENEIRQKNRLLEEAIESERAANEALKRAQAQLVQSEKLAGLGQLVAGVAHEINNPLAFVTSNVVVLQRDFSQLKAVLALYQSADARLVEAAPQVMAQINELAARIDLPYVLQNLSETLTRSREGLRRIQQIVKDLREFSRQEAVGDMQQSADLNAGIESTVNIIGGRARGRNVELELDLAKLPGITCHPAKINQVVMNLISNAIDACADGGRVTIRSRCVAGGVEVEVRDDGCGISASIREKIFDPFFTTKPQGKGTGLGLSISHGIVAEHSGRIEVESEQGKGAVFTVFLPTPQITGTQC